MSDPQPTPKVDAILQQIDAFGYGTVEYHDCLGFLLMTMARSQWRRADAIRASERDSARRRQRRCSACGQPGHTRRTCAST